MSLHKSLRVKSALVRHRNVLSKGERITRLEEEGRWSEGDAIYGLPKVRNMKKKKVKAAKVEAAATETVATETAVAEAATPAKGEKAPAVKVSATPAKKG